MKKIIDRNPELVTSLQKSDDPCWDGYTKDGTKMKGKKQVPNCVPSK